MKKNLKIGLIAGSFDVIHPGYIKMFQESKEEVCDYLIVALQDDPTIDRPNKLRPVQTWEERKQVLESIKYVNKILRYNTESELYSLLKKTEYDFRILGSDYKDKEYTGMDLKKEVYFCKRDHDYSLTGLKMKIYQSIKLKMENTD